MKTLGKLALWALPVLFLAAIVVPGSCGCDYTVRAKVGEGINAAAPAKLAVSMYYIQFGHMPSDAASAGVNGYPPGDYVEHISYLREDDHQAKLVIDMMDDLGSEVSAEADRFELAARGDDSGVDWTCRPGTVEPMDPKHLPSNCR